MAVRAVLSGLLICEKLFELGLSASVGVTTGTGIFCGVVGSKTRREYSVLGDSVNLAARLQGATKQSPRARGVGAGCRRVRQAGRG